MDKPLDINFQPANVESPLVIKSESMSVKKFKQPKDIISFVDKDNPFIIETESVPMYQFIDNDSIPVKFIERKVKLRIYLPGLNLPTPVLNRLIHISSNRYNHKTKFLTVISSEKLDKNANISNVYKLASNLLNEAWKADLNYVEPAVDPLLPHEKIQKELDMENLKAKEDAIFDVEKFADLNSFVLFRIPFSYPDPKKIYESQKEVQQIIEKIQN